MGGNCILLCRRSLVAHAILLIFGEKDRLENDAPAVHVVRKARVHAMTALHINLLRKATEVIISRSCFVEVGNVGTVFPSPHFRTIDSSGIFIVRLSIVILFEYYRGYQLFTDCKVLQPRRYLLDKS